MTLRHWHGIERIGNGAEAKSATCNGEYKIAATHFSANPRRWENSWRRLIGEINKPQREKFRRNAESIYNARNIFQRRR